MGQRTTAERARRKGSETGGVSGKMWPRLTEERARSRHQAIVQPLLVREVGVLLGVGNGKVANV